MTLKEAVGVRVDVDIKTGQKLTHSEVCGRMIDYLGGLEAVSSYIPFSIPYLCKKLKSDRHFNNTPMKDWDAAAGFVTIGANCRATGAGIWNLYRKHGITAASCSQGVSILKEAARRICEQWGTNTLEGLI